MNKLAVVVAVASLAVACKDSKKSNKAKEPEKGSAAAAPVDTGWVDRLPEVDDASKLSLAMTAGLVGIKADGSLYIGKPPAAGAPPLGDASAVTVDRIIPALGLSPAAPREDDALATVEAGSAAPQPFNQLAHPSQASGAPTPAKRATSAFAIVHPHDVTAGVIVFADAKAPAKALVDVVTRVGGFVAVRKGSELGALQLSFDRHGPPAAAPDKAWIEVRLGKAIEVEKVPSKAAAVASIDKLGEAVVDTVAVDVLVGPETTVDDLVKAVGVLRAAKVEAFGFGAIPDPSDRGEKGPRVLAWDYQQQGQGDAQPIRAAFDSALEPMRGCYMKALAKKADLAGTARLQMFLTDKGAIGKTAVVDAPKPLVTCVTSSLAAVKFPAAGPAGVILDARIGFLPR